MRVEGNWHRVQEAGETFGGPHGNGNDAWRNESAWKTTYDPIFENAAKYGQHVLVYLYARKSIAAGKRFWAGGIPNQEAERSEWFQYVWTFVQRYGRNGKFWKEHKDHFAPQPVTMWEVWNEPNLIENNPWDEVRPELYAKFFNATADTIEAATDEQVIGSGEPPDVDVYIGGLYGPGMLVSTFFQKIKEESQTWPEYASLYSSFVSKYDGMGLHPYYFEGGEAQIVNGVKTLVEQSRIVLNQNGGGGKKLPITELGWPIAGLNRPTVTENQQASLITQIFPWIASVSGGWNIPVAILYSTKDLENADWAYHCGLRGILGQMRPAWWAYQQYVTGAPAWPIPPEATTAGPSSLQPFQATLNGTIDPQGLTTYYQFEFGKVSTPYFESNIPKALRESEDSWKDTPVAVNRTVTGLLPNESYRYRIRAQNVTEQSKVGAEQQFKTPSAPPLTTSTTSTNVIAGHATLSGEVHPQGTQSGYHVEWGTGSVSENRMPLADVDVGSGRAFVPVSQTIPVKGLTTYRWRIAATNVAGTTYGDTKEFTTPSFKPKVTIEPPTGVLAGNATIRGKVNPEGFATDYRFEWGTTTAYGNSTPIPDAAVGSGEVPVTVSRAIGVFGMNTYHYRIVATNQEGTTEGPDQTFTTPDWRPVITTKPATSVRANRVTINGAVNPQGFFTTYQIEYGFDGVTYGSKFPLAVESGIPMTQTATNVSMTIPGLSAEATYHYRIAASNREGKTVTADQTVRTTFPTTLCKVNGTMCTTANQQPKGLPFQAGSANLSIQSGKGTAKCTSASLQASLKNQVGTPMPIEPANASVSNCNILGFPVSIETQASPYRMGLEKTTFGNGVLSLGDGGKGNPGIKFSNPIMGELCTYNTPSYGLTFKGGNPPTLEASYPLNWVSGSTGSGLFCATAGAQVTATYTLPAMGPAYATGAPFTGLCSTATNPCPTGSMLPGGTAITAKSAAGSTVVFVGSGGAKVECAESTISGTTSAIYGGALPLQITGFTFASCTNCPLVEARNLPYRSAIERGDGSNGTLVAAANEKGQHPSIRFSSCSGGGFPPVAGALEIPFSVSGGAPGKITASEVPLPLTEGYAPGTIVPKFSGSYNITSQAQVYVGAAS